jgi:hypothetical protein
MFSKILNKAKWFVGVVGAITIVWKIAIAVNGKDNDITTLKQDVKDIKMIVMPLKTQNDSIDNKLFYINKKVNRIDGMVGVVKTQLGIHIIKTSTDKQDIINWFNATEEKKNLMMDISRTQ